MVVNLRERGRSMKWCARTAAGAAWFAVALCATGLAAGAAFAQDPRQNQPGEFDFYVLALSWSPSYCAANAERLAARAGERAAERAAGRAGPPERKPDGATPAAGAAGPATPVDPAGPAAGPSAEPAAGPSEEAVERPARGGPAGRRRADPQCGARPYSFVVHGLWPQYERGFPEFCQTPPPRLSRTIVASMLDLMPSPRLVFRQWDRHGVCSGLPPSGYFEAVRKARALVKIPPDYLDLTTTLMVSPGEVEEAFVKANPGLPAAGVAVQCDRTRLREVRICLSREFKFQECPEVDRRACRRDRLAMPPVRGG